MASIELSLSVKLGFILLINVKNVDMFSKPCYSIKYLASGAMHYSEQIFSDHVIILITLDF